uniref:Uncharacterized protein n=1 Tax=Trichobilharzia regenti TaxID=157069 RepID=A0AA85J6I8_TRIRE|nr:unnamed protein product [Trichobilharzia regenti]
MDDSKETPQSIPLRDLSVSVNGVQASFADDDKAYYLYDVDNDEQHQSASRDLDNATPKTLALCNRYPCHYGFYVYFPSTTIDDDDDDLIPFHRKAFMDKVSRLQNPEYVKEVLGTKCTHDAYSDRRIRSIE